MISMIVSFNRTTVECKLRTITIQNEKYLCFNRTTVECKSALQMVQD